MSAGPLASSLTVGPADVVDIAVVSALLYALFLGLRRTRATLVLAGLALLALLYLAALTARMNLTVFLFHGVFTVLVVALVVIFQEEVRRFLEGLALWMLQRRRRDAAPAGLDRAAGQIARVAARFAAARVGALIVLQGRDALGRHLEGGEALEGRLSEALLDSIFDPHSRGHDGAVVVDRDRITRFACHLPLTDEPESLEGRGTRHAAGLGLSERSDALCIVVSEERGTISIARHGDLRVVPDARHLEQAIRDFHAETLPGPEPKPFAAFLRRNPLLKVAALLLAGVLWFFFSHEAEIEFHSYPVRITATGVPEGLAVASIVPAQVRVVVSGPRRAFYFVDRADFSVVLQGFEWTRGAQEATLAASDVTLPGALTFVNILPRTVQVELGPEVPRAGPTTPVPDR